LKDKKIKRKINTVDYTAKYSVEELLLCTNDIDENILKISNDLK